MARQVGRQGGKQVGKHADTEVMHPGGGGSAPKKPWYSKLRPGGKAGGQPKGQTRNRESASEYFTAGPVWSVLMGFLVLFLLGIFLAQNAHTIQIHFLWKSTQANFSIIAMLVALVAVVSVEAIAFIWRRNYRRISEERAQLAEYRAREQAHQLGRSSDE